MRIAIYSDVICPWCWIGKRRLEQALVALPQIRAEVTWHAYQLNPQMPAGGMPRADYRQRKFGSAAYAQALDQRVSTVAQQDGLSFDLAAQHRTPNTLAAHRLIWLAGQRQVQGALVETLFQAYFSAGLDIGDAAVLVRLATQHGLKAGEIATFLGGSAGRDEVLADEASQRQAGTQGVPLYLIDGHERISGAQPVDVFIDTLSRSAGAPAPADGCDDGHCRA
jgi:predicted DsbA family dithiol-disulfide isomerase